LVLNEVFRIGGLNTLRGFNEESLFASSFVIGTLEWRYVFEKNAAAFLFFDAAYYERNINSGYFKDFPYGFGAGVNFETKAGIFNLAYALGSEQNNPIEIRNAKIHFGFVNFF
jgi:hemolysin activation/secretion protein